MTIKKEYKNMKLQLTLNSLALILCCGDLIPSSTQPISTQEWQEIEKKLKSAHKEPSMITGMSIDTLTQIIGLDEFTAHKIEKRQKLLPNGIKLSEQMPKTSLISKSERSFYFFH